MLRLIFLSSVCISKVQLELSAAPLAMHKPVGALASPALSLACARISPGFCSDVESSDVESRDVESRDVESPQHGVRAASFAGSDAAFSRTTPMRPALRWMASGSWAVLFVSAWPVQRGIQRQRRAAPAIDLQIRRPLPMSSPSPVRCPPDHVAMNVSGGGKLR